jgi:NAD-dependent deacetylase
MDFKMTAQKQIKKACELISSRKQGIAFTGAGMSTASGIPDFRSQNGIWSKQDVFQFSSLESFKENPKKTWDFYHTRLIDLQDALPNLAHFALVKLEEKGFLSWLITQNVDGLHQRSGSKNIMELHGSFSHLSCLTCSMTFNSQDIKLKWEDHIPYCTCGAILKPGVVLFGESLPGNTFQKAVEQSIAAGFMIVAGTSAVVYPAAQLPYMAKRNGAVIIEINREQTTLSKDIADLSLLGEVEQILPQIISELGLH